MVIFWQNIEGSWQAESLTQESCYVRLEITSSSTKLIPCEQLQEPTAALPSLLLAKTGGELSEQWHVLHSSATRLMLNGVENTTGIAALHDRDVLAINGQVNELFFSTERLPCIDQYTGAPGQFCARCKRPLEAAQKVVACPVCRAVHHQQEPDYICWTYADSCSQCDRATDLSEQSYRWTPDEL